MPGRSSTGDVDPALPRWIHGGGLAREKNADFRFVSITASQSSSGEVDGSLWRMMPALS